MPRRDENFSSSQRLPTRNYILNSLSEEEYARLQPDLEAVALLLGQILYRAEEPVEYVYFPSNSMVSVVATTSAGQCAEVGVIGWEGMTGMDVLMGSGSTLNDHVVQHPNGALRIKTAAIRKEFKRGGALHDSLLSFARLMMIQIGQTALCNRLHTAEERLARWLLLCRDRAGTDELRLTQEFLAIMVGANRVTVTRTAIALQGYGYIDYVRGRVIILDRERLEKFSCDCYRTVKREYNRLLT